MLLPTIPIGSVSIMDNARFHRKSQLPKLAKYKGCSVLFLPPYSPDFNPIEHFWAWSKQKMRKILSEFPSFDAALSSIFKVV